MLSGGKICIIAFLAILTTLEMILADQALNLRDSPNAYLKQTASGYTDRANTETAGEQTGCLLLLPCWHSLPARVQSIFQPCQTTARSFLHGLDSS